MKETQIRLRCESVKVVPYVASVVLHLVSCLVVSTDIKLVVYINELRMLNVSLDVYMLPCLYQTLEVIPRISVTEVPEISPDLYRILHWSELDSDGT